MSDDKTTHFGYQQVPEDDKARRVGEVFKSVAPSYDVMNDLMSLGLHRAWKRFALEMSGVREGSRVLDVASGSGDLAAAFAKRAGPTGRGVDDRHQRRDARRGARQADRRGHLSPRSPSATRRSCRFRPTPSTASRSPSGYAT